MAISRAIEAKERGEAQGRDHLYTAENYLNLSPEDVVMEFQAKW